MPIEITAFADLSAADVQANQAELTQRINEANPTLDLRRGVFHDLLAYLQAAITTRRQTNLLRYESAQSLLDIQADPTLADTQVVDRVLSNWGVTRDAGAAATGQVLVVLNGDLSVTIGNGAVFTADGMTFTSNAAYTAKSESALINSSSDRLLTQLSSGSWAFTIDVTATVAGSASLIKKNTLVVPSSPPNGYVTSYALNDFTGGLDPETNDQLLVKLQEGRAIKAPGHRLGRAAMLRNQAAYSGVLRSSIVGFGDAEMLRDQHTIWPGSLGGKADWYVRTQERAEQQTLSKTATLLGKYEDGGGWWQVEIGRDEAPGFYEVVSILYPSALNVTGTLPILSDSRGLDLTGDGWRPDIVTLAEGAFSRFQTAVVQFDDRKTDLSALSVGATATFNVTVRVMPLIGAMQDFISDYDNRPFGFDVLVKAPVPCFLQLSLSIAKKRTAADPDLDAIKAALAKKVNNSDFTGRLYASELQDVVHGYLPDGMSTSAIDMFGRMRWADGSTHYLRSSEVLIVKSAAGSMVSEKTVQWFLDSEDIAITVKTEVPVPQ